MAELRVFFGPAEETAEALAKEAARRGLEVTAELELEKLLKARPAAVAVDRLAKVNPPGGRHAQRYLDVADLLAAGISVYTTMEVDQLESQVDAIERITGRRPESAVPDPFLDQAEVVLVDQSVQTAEQLALRELALRQTALWVERRLLREEPRATPWPSAERLLVCVGPSPLSEKLVRAAKRLADSLGVEWLALHVDTIGLRPAERQRVAQHLELAARLGARVLASPTSHSLVEAVVEVSQRENVTRIVAGKPLGPSWRRLFTRSLTDEILARTRGIDIFVLGSDETEPPPAPAADRPATNAYLAAALLVALATALGLPLQPHLSPTNLVMLYLAAVVTSAYRFGRGPSNLAALLSVMAFDLVFVPPRLRLAVDDSEYIITFVGFLAVGLLVSSLTAQAREQARRAQQREGQALDLLRLSRELSRASSVPAVLEATAAHLRRHFGEAYLAGPGSEEIEPAAQLALETGSPVGKGTDTMPEATCCWLPLGAEERNLAVVGIQKPPPQGDVLAQELLEATLAQAATALARAELVETARQNELLRATERLQTALLNSISHDLRIPLVSIQGALSSLLEESLEFDAESRRSLLENAVSEAERLNRLVANLLQMTRLESGALKVRPVLCDATDLVATSVEALHSRLADHPVELDLPDDLPLVAMDYVLMQQVLINLLENAIAHSPETAPIRVEAACQGSGLILSVLDRGPGVPEEMRPKVFERFVRGESSEPGGSGLGLSICKALAEAHQGEVWHEPRPGGGSAFRLRLPLEAREGP
ncbi:MAG: DUF4118 domain-containing protein [Vulcanimicrobiota bacterium]